MGGKPETEAKDWEACQSQRQRIGRQVIVRGKGLRGGAWMKILPGGRKNFDHEYQPMGEKKTNKAYREEN